MSLTEIPRIVLLGPTNVGKSALFNRLTRTRKAIVCDRPGVTVDRHELLISDSPVGEAIIVDTGGVGPRALEHPLGAEIERAAALAVSEASVMLFVVDGTREMGVEEIEIASWLRRQKNIDGKPVWVVVNKSDTKRHDPSSYYALGFDKVLSLSAEHDEGVIDLWDELAAVLGHREAPEVVEAPPRVVVLGRPNVGKSTLLNAILGHERHVVSEVAGTTRDPIESEYINRGMTWRMIDTAGIRQPGRLERDVEWVAREKLKELAKQADVAVVVIDAFAGVTELDATIAGMALDFGLSLVLALNKWDLMTGEDAADRWNDLQRKSDLKLEFTKFSPWVKISGLTGKGIPELVKTIHRVLDARRQRVQTSKLNTLFEHKLRLHHHPLGPKGKAAKFYYLSQVSTSPPEFVLFSNLPGQSVHFSFRRFIVNSLRTEFGFEGTPIKLHFKTT